MAHRAARWRRWHDDRRVVERAHDMAVVQVERRHSLNARPGLDGALAAARDALVAHLEQAELQGLSMTIS